MADNISPEANLDNLAVAHHEAGHVIAAMLRGIPWTTATIVTEGDLAGHVRFDAENPTYNDHRQRAFVTFAGPWAESRFTGVPLREVLNGTAASDDRQYYDGHATQSQIMLWVQELEPHFPIIEAVALRLLMVGTLTPDAPDPLKDASLVASYMSGLAVEEKPCGCH